MAIWGRRKLFELLRRKNLTECGSQSGTDPLDVQGNPDLEPLPLVKPLRPSRILRSSRRHGLPADAFEFRPVYGDDASGR